MPLPLGGGELGLPYSRGLMARNDFAQMIVEVSRVIGEDGGAFHRAAV